MGLLDGVMGNASKIDAAKIQEEFSRILAPGEVVEHAYHLIRDYFVFSNKRLVLVDKQGMTGSKVEYHSLPGSLFKAFLKPRKPLFGMEC
ncbi:hypothetical protein D3C71_1347610 [compost metagenome]